MKKLLLPAIFAGLFLAACRKNDKPAVPEEPSKPEATFLRLIVSDVDQARISVIDPLKKTAVNYPVTSAQPSLYATSTGQFATIISRAAGKVEFFNTGVEKHGGHLHIHKAEMSPVKFSEAGPTHFFGHAGLNAVFNDGTGSLSLFKDGDLDGDGGTVLPVAQPHHGAMVIFDDFTIAVTQKDGSVSGTLPEKVKIIDRFGKTLHETKIATKGIHGDAGNGKLAAFGSADGILIVSQTGEQSLIPYPSSFGTAWIGTVLGNKALPHFFGYVSLGLFKIDPASKQITEVLKNNNNIHQYLLDSDGKNLYVLLTDGTLKIFDAVTTQLKKEGKITTAIPAGATAAQKPYFAVSRRALYITDQAAGAIRMLDLATLQQTASIPVGGKPFKLIVAGDQEGLEAGDH
ncbi:YncE family protein [Chitinophaga caseinilytica]|uniref:YncE family protein n=1 Tax=Chitinophaga caseinilytica TaxID=2267521 RepID=UPI003C2D81BB